MDSYNNNAGCDFARGGEANLFEDCYNLCGAAAESGNLITIDGSGRTSKPYPVSPWMQ